MAMLDHLIENTNECLSRNKLDKLMGIIWYQVESEAFQSNSALPTDLETLRFNLLNGDIGKPNPLKLNVVSRLYFIHLHLFLSCYFFFFL